MTQFQWSIIAFIFCAPVIITVMLVAWVAVLTIFGVIYRAMTQKEQYE